ncbi:MAG: tetratricopeptide (TPR) repeat protein [Pseudohongiellaceae bacterium]
MLGTACSNLEYWQLSDKQKLNQLLEQRNYYQALLLLENSSVNNPDHLYLQQQKTNITKLQRTLAYRTIHKSRQLIKKQQWPAAIVLLDKVNRNNPNQSILQHELDKILASQKQFVLQQKTAIAILQAQQFKPTKRLIEALLSADPSQVSYKTLQIQSEQVSADHFAILLLAAQLAADDKNWPQARSLVTSAKELGSNPAIRSLDQNITAAINKNQQQQITDALNQQRLKNIRLTQTLNNQHKNAQWQQALATIVQLQQQEHLSANQEKIIGESQQALSQHIEALINQGQHYYALGNLEKAIDYWQKAQQLSPNQGNINQKLKRAQRFLENLNKLP